MATLNKPLRNQARGNYCMKHHAEITQPLLKKMKDKCIKEYGGCFNCSYIIYRTSRTVNFQQHGLKLIQEQFEGFPLQKTTLKKLETIATHYGTTPEEFLMRIVNQVHHKITKGGTNES
jgi:hypothetical protein